MIRFLLQDYGYDRNSYNRKCENNNDKVIRQILLCLLYCWSFFWQINYTQNASLRLMNSEKANRWTDKQKIHICIGLFTYYMCTQNQSVLSIFHFLISWLLSILVCRDTSSIELIQESDVETLHRSNAYCP